MKTEIKTFTRKFRIIEYVSFQITIEALQKQNTNNNLQHISVLSQLQERIDQLCRAYYHEKLKIEDTTSIKKQLNTELKVRYIIT